MTTLPIDTASVQEAPQTDLQQLKALLRNWNVPFCMDRDGDRIFLIVGETQDYRNPPADTVDGFSQFYTRFEFAPGGIFTRMGAWE